MKKWVLMTLSLMVLVTVVIATVFYFHRPRPITQTKPVIKYNPTTEEAENADMVVKVHHQITISKSPFETKKPHDGLDSPLKVKAVDKITVNGQDEAVTSPEVKQLQNGDFAITFDEGLGVTVPKDPEKKNELGAYYEVNNGAYLYYRSDFWSGKFGRTNVITYGQVDTKSDLSDVKCKLGLAFKF